MDQAGLGPIAAMHLPKGARALSAYGKKVSAGMKGNAKLASPVLALSVLDGLITALDTSEGAMGGGTDKTAQRNADRLALAKALRSQKEFVQSVASQQATAADAAAVITSAAMFVRRVTRANKPPLAAKHGPVTGSALLVALAVLRAVTYYWEWSMDQKVWTALPDTTKARTTATGLAVGATIYFRVRALVRKTGQTDWSQLVSLVIQ